MPPSLNRRAFLTRFLPSVGLCAVGALVARKPSSLFAAPSPQPRDTSSLFVSANVPTTESHFATIAEAMRVATPGTTIAVAPGVYEEDVVFAGDDIHLIGSGRPTFDGAELSSGTVIRGRINCNGKRGAIVSDLGVDIRGTEQVDAITSGNMGVAALNQKFERLTLVGKGSSQRATNGHALLCAAGSGNWITDVHAYNWYHGIALRCSDSYVGNCVLVCCRANSVIIKSAVASGDASNNVVEHCTCIGDAADLYLRAGPIRLQAMNSDYVTRGNTIRNITFEYSGEAAVLIDQVAGEVSDTTISGVTCRGGGDHDSRAEFDSNGGSNNTFEACVTVQRNAGFGFRNRGGVNLTVIDCIGDNSGQGQQEGIESQIAWPYTNRLPSLST